MGCALRRNRHGYLAIRVWGFTDPQGRVLDTNEGAGLKDTPANRAQLKADAACIAAEIKAGRFEYLRWFPNGNKADLFRPEPPPAQLTFCEYAERWLARQLASPDVRKGTKRDYRRFLRWVSPRIGHLPLARITRIDLEELRG